MKVTRREFFGWMGLGAAGAVLPGCANAVARGAAPRMRIALQLYSIRHYIGGKKGANGSAPIEGVGLDRALENLSAIGFEGVEFAGYYQYRDDPKGLRRALANAGLRACGTHSSTRGIGMDTGAWVYDPEVLKRVCAFNLDYGNNLIICPGDGNIPPTCSWSLGQSDAVFKPTSAVDEWIKRLVGFYNQAAADAARVGCRIGIRNHTWEHAVRLTTGETYWDYFFANTDPAVCMEQDVGWATCAGVDPAAMYEKFPHRSPTLHAKENGMGPGVTAFDGILGRPGEPGACPVAWDRLLAAAAKDGVSWAVIECERHFDDLSAVLPSYEFLKRKI